MRFSYLKKWPLLGSVFGVCFLFCFYFFSRPEPELAHEVESDPVSLEFTDAKSYEVQVQLNQDQGKAEQSSLLSLEGILEQGLTSDEGVVSTWTSVSRAQMLGKDALQDFKVLESKAIKSRYQSGEVYLEHLFPEGILFQVEKIQLALLHKILLPREWVKAGAASAERLEKDDVGLYTAAYSSEDGQDLKVIKSWISYETPGIKVDPETRSFHYVYDKEGRLLSVSGSLTLHYETSPPTSYTTSISMKISSHKLVGAKAPRVQAALKKVSVDTESKSAAPEMSQAEYELVLEKIAQIQAQTPSGEVYKIFSALKVALAADPSRASELSTKILSSQDRSDSGKRKLSLMFGAIAQTKNAEALTELIKLSESCPDTYCKVQAIVGVSDHPIPTPEAAERMISIAGQNQDPDVRGTALLSAGSLGQKLGEKLPQLSPYLISEIGKPESSDQKTTILAAMGNHGAADYLPSLEAELKSERVKVRAAAVYSLRSLPQPEINGVLLSILDKEKDKDVLREAYKALDYRDMESSEYSTFVQRTVNLADAELQQMAARALVHASQDHPAKVAAAIQQLRSTTTLPQVRDYLDAEAAVVQQ